MSVCPYVRLSKALKYTIPWSVKYMNMDYMDYMYYMDYMDYIVCMVYMD